MIRAKCTPAESDVGQARGEHACNQGEWYRLQYQVFLLPLYAQAPQLPNGKTDKTNQPGSDKQIEGAKPGSTELDRGKQITRPFFFLCGPRSIGYAVRAGDEEQD